MTVQTARRKLEKNGYYSQKSRKKIWTQYDYCGYAIWDPNIGFIIEGMRHELELCDVISFVSKLEKDNTIQN